MAAVIVTIMLIPQSLAYAMLAGLPPVVGLYASILPLVVYALFGSSRTLSVGLVAVVSLLTATPASGVAAPGSPEYVAVALALLSGLILIGQVPGTEHFRNVLRHEVICTPEILGLRIDESLFFANARAIESIIQNQVATRPRPRHVVLNCAAVNSIDASALESLELVMHRLADAGIALTGARGAPG